MKQIFMIETDDGLSNYELLGCLEDTIGEEQETLKVTHIGDLK